MCRENEKQIKLNKNDARDGNRIRRRQTNIGHFKYQNRMLNVNVERKTMTTMARRKEWMRREKKSRHFLCHLSRDTFKIHYRRTLYRIISYVYVERACRSKLYTLSPSLKHPRSPSAKHTENKRKKYIKIDDRKTTYVSMFIIISGGSSSKRMSVKTTRMNTGRKKHTHINTETTTSEKRLDRPLTTDDDMVASPDSFGFEDDGIKMNSECNFQFCKIFT